MKDPSNGDVVDVTRKDNARERVIKLNGNVILDGHAYLIPWVKQDFKNPTADSEKIISLEFRRWYNDLDTSR